MKKLPLGIQTFSEIINRNYLYIDKTGEIASLLECGKAFFISRPRRFGKSLLVSTLKEIFRGNRQLFRGLVIYDRIGWEPHPVVHIDFSLLDYRTEQQLSASLFSVLDDLNTGHALNVKKTSLKIYFEKILAALYHCYNSPVVILVDEYDKPIIDLVEEPVQARVNRDLLRDFYTVLKGADAYLHFIFITGVSKFSKVSVFSGMNNLTDISLSSQFAALLGITETELVTAFNEQLISLAAAERISTVELKARIRYWYNGYSWDGVQRVYNPTSLLHLFFNQRFGNYWFATGTPAFLVNLLKIKQVEIAGLEERMVSEHTFESYDVDNLTVYPLLFQTGYLTITGVRQTGEAQQYRLGYPNFEVKQSFLNYAINSQVFVF